MVWRIPDVPHVYFMQGVYNPHKDSVKQMGIGRP